jgi:hypothetical protein
VPTLPPASKPVPASTVTPVTSLRPTKAPPAAPLEQSFADFAGDRLFAEHPPTREQVARAWAYARYKKEDENTFPTHLEVVGALKKLFPEFRSSKPKSPS